MLVTRHQDRPGTMGTVGRILGESDVNISAMYLARTEARADAFMILALDDAVPEADRRPHPCRGGRPGPVAHRPGVSDGPRDATLVLVRHGQTTWVAEGRFQGSADPPLSHHRRAAGGGRRAAPRPAPGVTGPAGARRAPPAYLALAPGPCRIDGRAPSGPRRRRRADCVPTRTWWSSPRETGKAGPRRRSRHAGRRSWPPGAPTLPITTRRVASR